MLHDIILKTRNDTSFQTIFNNAAQVWNHDFYWKSLSPQKTTASHITDSALLNLVEHDFENEENLKESLKKTALGQFGSGWCWLILDNNTLKVIKTSNAENPLGISKPLLCIDVWEHAYYLDYQNKRGDYLNAVIDNLLDWNFAAKNLNT